MDEDLLHDLSKYKSYRDKSVSASAQSLIQLFRERNPHLLERKDRGKPTEFQRNLLPLDYGQVNPSSFLEGAELLDDVLGSSDQQTADAAATDDDDDDEENEGSEDGDWVNVSHSDDDDDDDEGGAGERQKRADDDEQDENEVRREATRKCLGDARPRGNA
jgi:protein SDA1